MQVLQNSHHTLDTQDAEWLNEKFQQYKVKNNNPKELLVKMDIIPPSLAIAQAAYESGWGTSRFAIEGNALFGQWSKKKITFIEKNWIRVNLDKKFKERTGRINCSLLDNDKQFRWLGIQFVIDGN